MFWQIFNSLLAERRVTRIFLWGTNAAEESKDQFLEINILVRALTVQLYKPIILFFPVSCNHALMAGATVTV